jgi:hypothetical protein
VVIEISIILIENIDFAWAAGHAGFMTSHRCVKRRHVDLVLVASAVCRQESIDALLSVG